MEYKILCESASSCQKKLNQWVHHYNIQVLSANVVSNVNANEPTILLVIFRERK